MSSVKLPEPLDWQEFERLTEEALKIKHNNPNFTRHGRPGQAQQSVDVYSTSGNGIIGAQCKLTWGKIDTNLIQAEVNNANAFQPALTHLHICTTAKKDAHLQKFVRNLRGNFTVDILFWEDISMELVKNPLIYKTYYNIPSPQISTERRRDIQTLKLIFSSIYLNNLERELETLPRSFSYLFQENWIFFNGFITQATFNLYDKDLEGLIRNFHSTWSEIMDCYCYEDTGSRIVFPIPCDVFRNDKEEKIFRQLELLRVELSKTFQSMITYILKNYIEIDLEKLGEKAWENHKKMNKDFNDIFK